MIPSMKPHEKLRSLLWGLIWYLLPLSYIIVDRFLPFDQAINIYPLVLIQFFIACGLLYWGINNTTEQAVRKIWLWMQAYDINPVSVQAKVNRNNVVS